jgi:NADPH:quinone reductase
VVFDSVGSTLMDSFAVTKECGTVVFYGMSGGDPAHVNPKMLMDTSKTLTGGDLWSYINPTNKESNAQNNCLSGF